MNKLIGGLALLFLVGARIERPCRRALVRLLRRLDL